jgi:hypothetical protein
MSLDLAFVQVDTAVFAYEPVLKCLQRMSELPLEQQVLNLTPSSGEALSGIQPTEIINNIRDNWQQDLQNVLGSQGPVQLDLAQAESLITGLAKRLSIIQGPPGQFICYFIFIPDRCMLQSESRSSSGVKLSSKLT